MTRDFERWCETATVADRCEAAALLTQALFEPDFGPRETQDCRRALLHLVGDPSPKVRGTLASQLSNERGAPREIVRLLCEDADSIAVPLAGASRALLEDDLIDLAITGSTRVRCAIARRRALPASVAAALSIDPERSVAFDLLTNQEAEIAPTTLRAIAASLGEGDGVVRELLLSRHALPADIRHSLLLGLRDALSDMPLVRGALGERTARRIAEEACDHATTTIAGSLDAARMDGFVDHLRCTAQITPALLVRTACAGRLEFFAAALSSLSGLAFRRVRSILVDAREPAFYALCEKARLPADVRPLLLAALRIWKTVSRERSDFDGYTGAFVTERLCEMVRGASVPATPELRLLLGRLGAQAARQAARRPDLERLAA